MLPFFKKLFSTREAPAPAPEEAVRKQAEARAARRLVAYKDGKRPVRSSIIARQRRQRQEWYEEHPLAKVDLTKHPDKIEEFRAFLSES